VRRRFPPFSRLLARQGPGEELRSRVQGVIPWGIMAQGTRRVLSGVVALFVGSLAFIGVGVGTYTTLPFLRETNNIFLAATYFAMGCLVSIVVYALWVSPVERRRSQKPKEDPTSEDKKKAEAMAMEEAKKWSQELEERVEERTHELEKTSVRLMRTREKLFEAEKLAFLGHLAAGISHQMKNPLGIIKTASFYVTDASDDAEIQEQANIIAKESDRLVETINGLLRFARQAAASVVGDVDLCAVVEDTLQAVQLGGRFKDIDVVTEMEDDLPLLRGDTAQIQQVVINFLTNAAQAMPEGGTLTVKLSSEGDQVKLVVSDTGVGIPPDKVERIWDPFVSDKPDGTGIGLAICKGILERHGAQTNVVSQEGMGTTFTVLFPLPEG